MKHIISEIKEAYYKIARQIDAPKMYLHFSEKPTHDGSPHVEYEGNNLFYVITERGSEFERRKTTNKDELLFWLISDLTSTMASKWELEHRKDKEDSRRQSFSKNLELLGIINQNWMRKQKVEYEKILLSHPCDDLSSERAKYCATLYNNMTTDQALAEACIRYPLPTNKKD